jgi:hypothetical protein
MRAFGEVDFVNPAVNKVERWICPKCGHCIDLVDFSLDEFELENILRLYEGWGLSGVPGYHVFTESLDFPEKEKLKGGALRNGKRKYK